MWLYITKQLLLATSLLWLLIFAGKTASGTETVYVINKAYLQYTTSKNPPLDGEFNGVQRTLPNWLLAPQKNSVGWYGVEIELETTPSTPWGLYLPEVAVNAAVFLNGQLVGHGIRYDNQYSPLASRPLYLQIPIGLLRAGSNRFYIQLNPIQPLPIFTSRIHIGPATLLKERFGQRMFWRINIPTTVQIITLLANLYFIILWLKNRQQQHYLWLVAATLFWTMHTVDLINDATWQERWAIWIGLIGFSLCLIMFLHRYYQLHRPLLERALFLVAILGAIFIITLPPDLSASLSLWPFQLGFVMATLYSSRFVWYRYRRSHTAIDALMLITLSTTSLFAIYEWFISVELVNIENYHFLYFSIPMLQITVAITLIHKYLHSLQETQILNEDLTLYAQLRTVELGEQHERLRTLERAQVLATERERMVRDMHDGVGGQLVSALAMLESDQYTNQQLAEHLRATLNDLRLILDSLDPSHNDLYTALTSLRSCINACLQSQQINLQWSLDDFPCNLIFNPQQILQVLRIVQEAVTNIIKHASAQTVTIRCYCDTISENDDVIVIEIIDDGMGIKKEISSGRGMKIMAKRANDLIGRLEVTSNTEGTHIRLKIPLQKYQTLE